MSDNHKAHGVGFYFAILCALLCLTLVTYLTARVYPVPEWANVPLALTIATTKASLVVWFFMHLSEHSTHNKVFFGASVFFVALLIAFVLGDVTTRLPTTNPNFPTYKELRGSW